MIQPNLGGIVDPRLSTMSPEELFQELARRQKAKAIADERAAQQQTELSKALLREVLSQDAIFSITYVPFVIAEIVWDYIDTIIDQAAIMKISATRKLCHPIRQLRRSYDRRRYTKIDERWRRSETNNMILFQETLSDYFDNSYKAYRYGLKVTYPTLEENSLMLVSTVYVCLTILRALVRYTRAHEAIISKIVGYKIAPILPEELRQIEPLVRAFIGDKPLPKNYDSVIEKFETELFEYINDTKIED